MVSCGPSSRYLTSSLTLHKFYFAQTLNRCIKVSIHLSTHSSRPIFQTHFFFWSLICLPDPKDSEMNKTWNQLLIIRNDLGTELYKVYKIDFLEYKSKDSY